MPESSYITGWRTAWSAFRTPGRRLEALLVTAATTVAYLMCLAVAWAVAMVAGALAVEPALTTLSGWTLDSAAAQIGVGFAEGGAIGAPTFLAIVWLARRGLGGAQRMIDGWFERNGER